MYKKIFRKVANNSKELDVVKILVGMSVVVEHSSSCKEVPAKNNNYILWNRYRKRNIVEYSTDFPEIFRPIFRKRSTQTSRNKTRSARERLGEIDNWKHRRGKNRGG
uniref:(northern house mosquito) hypothetical protein n=1 Tax=Culex pipiens TaxID=7175 RepID=A0A8D8HZ76_CULPI